MERIVSVMTPFDTCKDTGPIPPTVLNSFLCSSLAIYRWSSSRFPQPMHLRRKTMGPESHRLLLASRLCSVHRHIDETKVIEVAKK